jgi:hypothetical protein
VKLSMLGGNQIGSSDNRRGSGVQDEQRKKYRR